MSESTFPLPNFDSGYLHSFDFYRITVLSDIINLYYISHHLLGDLENLPTASNPYPLTPVPNGQTAGTTGHHPRSAAAASTVREDGCSSDGTAQQDRKMNPDGKSQPGL